MNDVVDLGLLKMDFLGLRNLDVIDKAVELVGGVDIGTLPLDDPKTYAMLARGDSTGVFQFESSGMREALRSVKPTEFEDLIALVALYRPGPMGYIPMYAARKAGREQVSYADPRLEAITGQTYAICIYQEQYMQIAKELAGFSPAEAETLRKAIGKKIHSLMASLKDKFLAGCAENQVAPAVAQQLWKDMESSQDYSFNKAHAACYALIAYRTAWLKANHPKEYMAALISSVMNTKDRVPFYVNACREMGIDVLPPDVNSSQQDFAVVGGVIHFGLNAVKNVGEAAAEAIVRVRAEGGPFESIWELTERVDPQVLNKRALESLVKCGALDSTGRDPASGCSPRSTPRSATDSASPPTGSPARRRSSTAPSARRSDPVEVQHPPLATTEFDERELLRLEKETLGLYVSEHPLERVRAELRRKTDCALTDLERTARRRVRHRRRHRVRPQAGDDEARRADGLRHARRSDRKRRGRRLQLDLRRRPRAARARPHPRREGARRPQAGGRDEARRERGERVRVGADPPRGSACGSTRVRRPPGSSASSRCSWPTSRATRPSTSRSRPRSASARSRSAPSIA